ncbi:hydrogenase nickel incorporation protein HypB [Desulfobotulus mexicanus]|uniref:Hydrogenase nickel incorporation protein HypB n=1 Tax=Desulfobotulus mexicanus TaxID=2586642 RepID=A0A5Q4VEI1_9BACT|nr:hydrogenase nickel incorporation protein HypB [Desulfobotulus mexicanus]TYT75373.1 hydrogenase nickel incorporation protein HypB [Desulfobotulus mexicanus]
MDQVRIIDVKEDILADNGAMADELRSRLKKQGLFLVNLMASPGAGKTSFLLKTAALLSEKFEMGVLEADIESSVDGEKMAAAGLPVIQLRTGGFCHLDASMVISGLDEMNLEKLNIIFIENVGNLVCPAEFDTGAHLNMMIASLPEGDDKPLKYPLMFSVCDIIIVNKTDMQTLCDFNLERFTDHVRRVNSRAAIIPVSCTTGEGFQDWIAALDNKINGFQK